MGWNAILQLDKSLNANAADLWHITKQIEPQNKIIGSIPKKRLTYWLLHASMLGRERYESHGTARPCFCCWGLKLQKDFYTIPTDLEKFGELYETPLSSENPTNNKSYTYIYIYIHIYTIHIDSLINIIKSIIISVKSCICLFLWKLVMAIYLVQYCPGFSYIQ